MDEFIKELMEAATEWGYYEDIPVSVISVLLEKHYDIKFDVGNYHFRPIKLVKKSAVSSLVSEVYGEVIAEQLEQTSLFLSKGRDDGHV